MKAPGPALPVHTSVCHLLQQVMPTLWKEYKGWPLSSGDFSRSLLLPAMATLACGTAMDIQSAAMATVTCMHRQAKGQRQKAGMLQRKVMADQCSKLLMTMSTCA